MVSEPFFMTSEPFYMLSEPYAKRKTDTGLAPNSKQTALWCLSLCALLGIRLKGISPALSGSDTSQGLRQRGTFAGKKVKSSPKPYTNQNCIQKARPHGSRPILHRFPSFFFSLLSHGSLPTGRKLNCATASIDGHKRPQEAFFGSPLPVATFR
jgi:hypothetical protein